MPERPIIVFDVNKTLLDLQAIRPVFDRIFSDPAAMRLWFAGLITYSGAHAGLRRRPVHRHRRCRAPDARRHPRWPPRSRSIPATSAFASHVWDTLGAVAADRQAALIFREGNAPLDVGPQPDYIGKDLDVIAAQLIERYAAAEDAPAGRGADRP